MARWVRVGAASFVALGGVLACQSIIGADFGSYTATDDGTKGGNAGESAGARGGDGNGGRGGDVNGGSAGSAAAGGAAPGGGTDSGGTGQGGAGMGGEGASGATAGEGGNAGSDPGPLHVTRMTGGHLHSCAAFQEGGVKCWGYNFNGELGLDDRTDRGDQADEVGDTLPFVNLGAGRLVQRLAGGYNHTCALLDGGEVKCWGKNDKGQLGLGDTESRGDAAGEMAMLPALDFGSGLTPIEITAGILHTCVVFSNGSVKCWGDNTAGCLGLGVAEAVIGDEADETPDLLAPVDLGGLRAVRVSAGSYTTCVLLENASVKCWGQNTSGELGTMGASRGTSPSDMGATLPAVDLGEEAIDVQVGGYFVCALLQSRRVKCWGSNSSGEVGLGSPDYVVSPPRGTVALGTDRTVTAIAVGQAFTCALLDTEAVKCWGSNSAGALGLGRNTGSSVGRDPAGMGDALPAVNLGDDAAVLALGSGFLHTCAIFRSNRRIKCWGFNDEGQLGLGDTRDRGVTASDMGNALPFVELGMAP